MSIAWKVGFFPFFTVVLMVIVIQKMVILNSPHVFPLAVSYPQDGAMWQQQQQQYGHLCSRPQAPPAAYWHPQPPYHHHHQQQQPQAPYVPAYATPLHQVKQEPCGQQVWPPMPAPVYMEADDDDDEPRGPPSLCNSGSNTSSTTTATTSTLSAPDQWMDSTSSQLLDDLLHDSLLEDLDELLGDDDPIIPADDDWKGFENTIKL